MTEIIPRFPMHFVKNVRAHKTLPYGPELKRILSHGGHRATREVIRSWPGYHPTPLRSLDGLAGAAGAAKLYYKDESERFALGSFKALGGAYAVYSELASWIQKRTGEALVSVNELSGPGYRQLLSRVTVTCATDGNHGRSVAWGAQLFGCKCVVYIHQGVSSSRERAIASYGARIVRTGANYDESVRRCAADAERFGRIVISDTSYPGYLEIPRRVMQGYTVMIDEALQAMDQPPTHLFVQGGVGGLAASVCAYLWELMGAQRPVLAVVEPDKANCIFESVRAGKPVQLEGNPDTMMAGLACGEVSLLAWEILSSGADFVMSIPDRGALETMRLLSTGVSGDRPVVGGESGVAGLAGFLAAVQDNTARRELDLHSRCRVLTFGTEGATDPELYLKIVGRSATQVLAGDDN